MKRPIRLLLWALVVALYGGLYFQATRTWFQQDDFAWLSQGLRIHSFRDWLEVVFAPRAQGTLRPWSERLFFLVLFDRFGLDHRPFHLWVALTQMLNLGLLQAITFRLTRSRLATLAAPALWLCGIGLATPLGWLSAYNQVLCATFLLGSFLFLLKYIETKEARWWWAQVAVFVLGFGALEIQIVYPALAIGWCLLAARPQLRRALTLIPISLAYGLLHFLAAPNPTSGVYARYWDFSIVRTFGHYAHLALSGAEMRLRGTWPGLDSAPVAIALGLAALGYAAWSWRADDRVPAFGLAWFALLLAPVLPLRDHVMEYYVAAPSLGLAWLGAAALARARRAGALPTVAVVAVLALHLIYVLPANQQMIGWRYSRGVRIRTLVLGLERAHDIHPGKTIVLTGVDSDIFWLGLYDHPQRLFGLEEVCVDPANMARIEAHAEIGSPAGLACLPGDIVRAAGEQRLVVYAADGPVLRNITRRYLGSMPAAWKNARQSTVDLGQPSSDRAIGPGWYPAENGARWMGRHGELFLAPPPEPGYHLSIAGYTPAGLLKAPLSLTVRVNGTVLGRGRIRPGQDGFSFSFALPAELAGADQLHIELDLDRTHRIANDSRELGLAFGQVGLLKVH
jgi:hypothetical protein